MIFGLRELAAQRAALVERSTRLRADLVEGMRPLNPGIAVVDLLRTVVRWGSRAALLYSLLRKR